MSTRSRIMIREIDGTEKAIYCHNDGYIEGVGVTLQLAYNTPEKVRELIALGNLSSLGYYINPKTDIHSFENREADVCVAYHRDRGEDLEFWMGEQEYNYTFDVEDGCWYVSDQKFVSNTTAQKELGLDWAVFKRQYLLLDAIIEQGDWLEEHWADDAFAKKGEVVKTCIEKAKLARYELNKEKAEREEAYYRAYCD